MADGLKSAFRSLTLEPTSEDFFSNYYVNRKDSPIIYLKNEIINTGSAAKVLFGGHRGSGKTTELRYLENILENEGFFVVFVGATKDMNVQDLYYTDLLLMLIKKTIELGSAKVKLQKKQKRRLEENLRAISNELVKEDIIETKTGFGLKAFSNWVDLFFRRDRTTRETVRIKADSLIPEIISMFNSMVKSIEDSTSKKIVIIVDDIEKVADEPRMVDILLKHTNVITGLQCHIVMTVPSSLFYSPSLIQVGQTYGITYFLPPFRVRNKDGMDNDEQIHLMENIIRKRVSSKVIQSDLLQNLAKNSGGLMHDFIRMLKVSLNNADYHQKDYVNRDNIEEAFNDLVNEYERVISPSSYAILKEVHQNKDTRKSKEFRELLFHLLVLEYKEFGKSWYAIHPAVEQSLINLEIIENSHNE